MVDVILYRPEIPQNTGNIGRLCSVTNSRLHLIHPLGFKITDRQLKRSGMDYWYALDIVHHESWDAFVESTNRPTNIWLLTTKSKQPYWDIQFQKGDGLLFGNEGSGVPQQVRDWVGAQNSVTIPHYNQEMRSLNLSTSVGITVYEAMRQLS